MFARLRPLPLCVLMACGAHSPSPPPQAQTTPAQTTNIQPPSAPPDPRELSSQAHFGDLVRLAEELDNGAMPHSEAGCLLRATEPLQFEADLSLSVRPLPPAPEQAIEAVRERAGAVSVMSPWGNVSGDLADATLLPFTTTSADAVKRPTLALFLTRDGVFLRGSQAVLAAPTTALSPDEAGSWLARVEEPATVYVTADRALELHKLVALLKRIPNRFEVALAVALPKGTRLPAPAADAGEGLCPDGLPEPGRDDIEGGLDAAAAQSALVPLREAALRCALSTGGRALLGGKLVLGLRIGKDGKAREACFVDDEIREALLRKCLLSSVRDLALPVPSPEGFADVHVPLQLELAGPKPQRAICD